jgi:two-component system, cell cycle sensor histidine kinase and response regulator CckA
MEDGSAAKSRELRHRAEALLREGPEGLKEVPAQDIQNIIHELQVHHIELEMQNEELRRTQLELHAERDKYAGLYDFAPVGYFTISEKGMIMEANLTGAAMFGMERGRLIGQPFSIFIDKDDQDTFYFHRKKLIEAKTKQTYELRILKKDKSRFHAQMECIPVLNENGTFAQSRAAVTNITDRKQAEEALRKAHDELERRVEERTAELVKANEQLNIEIEERKQAEEAILKSAEKYRSLVESTEDSIYLVDKDGTYLFVNKKHLSRIGSSLNKAIGRTYGELHSIDDTKEFEGKIEEVFETGRTTQHEHRSLRDDKYFLRTLSPVKNTDGSTTSVTVVSKDITERKRSEEEKERLQSLLQQSQKMEAIGRLAAGIAHDFNNILAIILVNAQLASIDVPDSNPISDFLKEIRKASISAKDIVHQLLAFSRMTKEQSWPIDMAPIIKESVKMLRPIIPTSIEFKQHISDDLCRVMGDAAQINQIVMNLVTNAADAMSKQGGVLEVALENIVLQEEKTCFDWILSPGHYVRLRMRDAGEGIEPKIMDRIFEPYYTTKEVGKGTGMGLSVIHGIVKRHGGGILVESELGEGTVFEIYFPALE